MTTLRDAFRDDRTPEQIERYERKRRTWPFVKCKGHRGHCGHVYHLKPGRSPWCGLCGCNKVVQPTPEEIEEARARERRMDYEDRTR